MTTDSRTWFYFPIVMPVNKDGQGPCELNEAAKLTWEVWDQELTSYASFDYLPDAINKAIELNEALEAK